VSLAATVGANATINLSGDTAAEQALFMDAGASDTTLGALAASGDDEAYAFPSTLTAAGGNISATAQPWIAPTSGAETESGLWNVYDPIIRAPNGSGPKGSTGMADRNPPMESSPSTWRSSSRQPQ
jgi:hypothetical protein